MRSSFFKSLSARSLLGKRWLLLARTLEHLRLVDPGFDASHLVTFTTVPSLAGYTADQTKSLRLALTEKVRDLPDVLSVAVASRGLMRQQRRK